MTYTMQLMNLQNEGECLSLSDANKELNAARKATPTDCHHLFRSSIRYVPDNAHGLGGRGLYCWSWYLIG